jgi:nitrate reductase cytochrome c-type subunit
MSNSKGNGYVTDSRGEDSESFRTTESSKNDESSLRNRVKKMQLDATDRTNMLSMDDYSVVKNTNNMIQIHDLENHASTNSLADLKGSQIFRSKNSILYGSGENPDTFREEISI